MKQFIDYIPLIAFFIVYKMEERLVSIGGFSYTLGGIFSATEVLIASSLLVYGGAFLITRTISRTHLLLLAAVLVFCTFTLLFRQEAILKWKAPIVNWCFAAVFFASHYLGKQTIAELFLGHAIKLPAPKWKTVNLSWAGAFFFIGCANLFVAFAFHDYWVDFKVFGSMILMFLFVFFQMLYLSPYIMAEEKRLKAEKQAVNEEGGRPA